MLELADELAQTGGLEQSYTVAQRVARGEARFSVAIGTAIHWLATQHFGTETATRFFDSLASGAMLAETDPIFRLRNQLIANRNAAAKLVPVSLAALVIKALNQWASDEPMAQLSFRKDGPRPEAFPRFGKPRSPKRKREVAAD